MNKRINRTLTIKQKKILDFVSSFNKEHSYAPSLEEIASQFKLNAISTVHHHIKALKKKGYLKKEENQPRGVSLFEQTPDSMEIPLLGIIAAGTPIEPIENPEPIKVPKNMVSKHGDYYALKVQGDSMTDDGIWDNDIIVVKHQFTADTNDIVVAVTENGTTLKQLKYKDGRPYLQPKNPKYKPIFPGKLEIRGKFMGLIRSTTKR